MVKSKNKNKRRKKIGQITVKKIGKIYAVCISGTPRELLNTYLKAEEIADKIREKFGRRRKRLKHKKKKRRRKR